MLVKPGSKPGFSAPSKSVSETCRTSPGKQAVPIRMGPGDRGIGIYLIVIGAIDPRLANCIEGGDAVEMG